ncbi:beta-mannosidase [Clostridium oryzae]|uniref:Beta-mannosidase B n=1 Tax=Clostridium oryzae TaxID=1450648 RepID=A0A1V4IU22_9CLOT|nr:glycoside hydrolase family 2 protein [Clostridium oryzae]OPJ63541.1 Exo-beta-D-glucosaminidase precursor [Clostridium oryzae]
MIDKRLVINLNGIWSMQTLPEGEVLNGKVPGSVLNDLLTNKKIEDPFWRDNEKDVKKLFYNDYSYTKEFEISKANLAYDNLELVCYGLDTLAEIYLNGTLLSETNNMHRTWKFNVLNRLNEGKNTIKIVFRSPLLFIEEKTKNSDITFAPTGCIPGNNYLRKAHCMFGWDWGPQLPDAGIWRNIQIEGYNTSKLEDVYVTQFHRENRVDLNVKIKVKNFSNVSDLKAICTITAPDGSETKESCHIIDCESEINLSVNNPELWWPNGYGNQSLYNVKVELVKAENLLDAYSIRIGLRTLTVSQEADEWGKEFAFTVNGKKIFAMGADYIPEDNIYSRITPERTNKLITDCARANFNCLRVWGGGFYPSDFFFDICDELGIIIWEDLMFACNIYEMTEEFEENIAAEVEDNVKRLRHHASLGLWCGNNEMETAWVDWGGVKEHSLKLKADYIKQFETLLPKVVKKNDPNTFYWASSPSSGGCFDDPNSENRGDVHNWEVWHGLKPFTAYRNRFCRFCSEFGFESFPSIKTVKTYTNESDRNIFSKIMEWHQRCDSGNGKILYYLSENYKYPKDFESMLYVSQLLQMEAVRYGVEHWRRYRGRCMGATYWQLNDCWPVASWASIDSLGRWKALHYGAKRFFSPLLASVEDDDTLIKIFVHNETLEDKKGKLVIKLKDKNYNVSFEKTLDVKLPNLSAAKAFEKDFAEFFINEDLKSELFLEYALSVDGNIVSSGSHLFLKAKHFDFAGTTYMVLVKDLGDKFEIKVKADIYAAFVELDFDNMDAIFSDNYFDITDAEGKTVYLMKNDLSDSSVDAADIEKRIKVRSIADTF